jgi:hypothetical protein
LIRVPGHEGIAGNETADQLERTRSEHPFIGPEPACGISTRVAKKAVRDWTNRYLSITVAKKAARDWTWRGETHARAHTRTHTHTHTYIYWESITGLRKAKGLILGPSARRTKDLLKLKVNQSRWVVGLFTGHCHLKGHFFKLALIDDPIWETCLEEVE